MGTEFQGASHLKGVLVLRDTRTVPLPTSISDLALLGFDLGNE
jgi:hypothetical protein